MYRIIFGGIARKNLQIRSHPSYLSFPKERGRIEKMYVSRKPDAYREWTGSDPFRFFPAFHLRAGLRRREQGLERKQISQASISFRRPRKLSISKGFSIRRILRLVSSSKENSCGPEAVSRMAGTWVSASRAWS